MGHAIRRLVLVLFAMIAAGPVIARADDAVPRVRAELLVASQHPAPGTTVPLAIVLDPGAHWHIYWQNPGDSGYPPRFAWHLPAGFSVGAIRHPAPVRLVLGGIAMNVHSGRTALLATLTVPSGSHPGDPLALAGSVDLLVCSDQSCVPTPIALTRRLTLGDGTPDPAAMQTIAVAQARLPTAIARPARLDRAGANVVMDLPIPAPGPGETLVIMPQAEDGGVPGAVHGWRARGNDLRVVMAPGTGHFAPGMALLAETVRDDGVPVHAWQLVAQTPVVAAASHEPSRAGWPLGLVAFAGAVLGGLVLNLMPCVFPILSLKALALARAGAGAGEARAEANGYLTGAVGTMMALGALVLGLRAGGQAVGWAFHLQSPAMVAVLMLVVAAIAVNLAGLFELPALGGVATRRAGFAGGLGTGALAAFVATPCTGPFMAGALGAALVLPVAQAMAVFAGLGLGLALPFVVVGWYEPARRWLPRPGRWMVTLRHALSLPMFATALALAWLVGQQAGVNAMTVALGGALMLGCALWWAGARQRQMLPVWPAWPAIAAALAVAALGVSATRAAPAATTAATTAATDFQPFSQTGLDALRRAHRPVLVYATAQWCLTCKVNEASSLSPAWVRAAFRTHGAVMMEADWTSSDPAVTALLTRHGRAGVPLYVWFPAQGDARILPQILTPGLVAGLVTS